MLYPVERWAEFGLLSIYQSHLLFEFIISLSALGQIMLEMLQVIKLWDLSR